MATCKYENGTIFRTLGLHNYNKVNMYPRVPKPPLTSSQTLYILASSSPLSERFPHSACKFIHRIKLQLAPPHALAHLSWFNNSSRTRCSLHFPLARSTILLKSPLFKSYSHWSRLPQEVKSRDTFAAFCSLLPAPKLN